MLTWSITLVLTTLCVANLRKQVTQQTLFQRLLGTIAATTAKETFSGM